MNDQVTPQQFVVFLFVLMMASALVAIYWHWVYGTGPVAWVIMAVRFVKRLLSFPVPVMSNDGGDRSPSAGPSIETDARQTPDRPAPIKRKAEEFLTLCILMRAHGVKREDAAAAFHASDLPFNNNVWAKAEPPEDEVLQATPIAGRPTRAVFAGDPDYPYDELP